MPEQAVRSLWQPVRARVLARYTGQLVFVLGLLTLAPVIASVALGDLTLTPWYAAIAVVLAGVGGVLARTEAPEDVRPNEALVVPALSFLIAPLPFSIPLVVSGVPPLDALFESVSGITTTGLSTLGSVEGRAPTLLFARSWLQWIGGLGFLVLALALLVGPGLAARRLGEENLTGETIVRSTRSRARRYLSVYVGLTALGCAALWLGGMGVFDAITHTLSAVSTGGFSTHDESLAAFGAWSLRAAVIALSLLGSISFSLYLPRSLSVVRRVGGDPEVRSLVAMGLAVSGLVVLFEWSAGHVGTGAPLRELPLVAFSAQTTAGFTSVAVGALAPATKLVLIAAMVVGGDLGSTAGGIKLLRLLVFVRVVQAAIRRRSMPPHAVAPVTLRGRPIEDGEALAALFVALLFVAVLAVSWLPFLAYGHEPLDALFEVASATGTVGLSAGVASPGLEAPLKAVLCADMWLGRLEVLPLLVVLNPATWRAGGEAET